MPEHEPKPTGDTDPTTADILYDSIQKAVEKWGPVARDRHITSYLASTEEVDESFIGFTEGEYALSFQFHVDDVDTATLDSLVAYPGYSEVNLRLWRGDEPVALDTDDENMVDNLYSVVILEGRTPFLANFDDLDGFMDAKDGKTYSHGSKVAGTEHFLEMAKHGQATMRLLNDAACAELLEVLSNPNLPDHITSD